MIINPFCLKVLSVVVNVTVSLLCLAKLQWHNESLKSAVFIL